MATSTEALFIIRDYEESKVKNEGDIGDWEKKVSVCVLVCKVNVCVCEMTVCKGCTCVCGGRKGQVELRWSGPVWPGVELWTSRSQTPSVSLFPGASLRPAWPVPASRVVLTVDACHSDSPV